MTRKKGVMTFLKAQFSAFTGGIVDIMAMIFFTEAIGIHYTLSIALGGIIGALVNFSINRNWTFRAKSAGNSSIDTQLLRFCIVVAGSILLKSAGTFLLTESLRMDYRLSRIMTDIVVSLGFNYTLQKNWVFVTAPSVGRAIRRSPDDRDKL